MLRASHTVPLGPSVEGATQASLSWSDFECGRSLVIHTNQGCEPGHAGLCPGVLLSDRAALAEHNRPSDSKDRNGFSHGSGRGRSIQTKV